jgi:hypothetical protein
MKESDMNLGEKEIFELINNEFGIKTNSIDELKDVLQEKIKSLQQQEIELNNKLLELTKELEKINC